MGHPVLCNIVLHRYETCPPLTSLSAASSRLAAWAEAVMVEATRLSITRAVPEIRVPLVTVSTLPRPT